MKLVLETTLFRKFPQAEALRDIPQCGYEYIEIGYNHFDSCHATDSDIKRLRAAVDAGHLKPAAIHGVRQLASLNVRKRTRAVKDMKSIIKNTVKLECGMVVSELSGDNEKESKCEKAFRKSISELKDELQKTNMTLCFEAHPGDFIEDSNVAVELLESFDLPQLKYLYCIPHTFILGNDPRAMIRKARPLLAYVHVADTLRPERTFFSETYTPKIRPHQHLIPGRGEIDFDEIFGALTEIKFDGFVTVGPFRADNPVEVAINTRNYLEKLIASHSANDSQV